MRILLLSLLVSFGALAQDSSTGALPPDYYSSNTLQDSLTQLISINSKVAAGASTSVNQDSEIAILNTIAALLGGSTPGTGPLAVADAQVHTDLGVIAGLLTAPLAVSGPLTDGQLRASAVIVDGSAVTQPVSAVALPLPTGASTSANQVTANTSLSSINSGVAGLLTNTQLRASAVVVDGSGVVQPVSASSLPLPAGASTESTLSGFKTANHTDLGVIAGLLTAPLAVDGSAHTQPISAASLPLPTGASSAAAQATSNSLLTSIDGKLTAPLSVTGPLTDTQLRASAVPISAASLPLPSGAATSSLQSTGNTSLSSIDTKLTTINSTLGTPMQQTGGSLTAGQGFGTLLASNSWWVKISDGTNAAAVVGTALKVDGSAVTQPVSASSLPLPAGAATSALQTTLDTDVLAFKSANHTDLIATQPRNISQFGGTNISTGTGAGGAGIPRVTVSNDSTVGLNAGSNNIGSITNITGTVSLPTGAATSANQTTANTSLGTIAGAVVAQATASGSATGMMVQGVSTTNAPSYTNNKVNPISMNNNGSTRMSLMEVGDAAITLGQKTMANSIPVAFASNQTLTLSGGTFTPSFANSYKHIAGAATTTVKSGSGNVHNIVINGSGSSTTVTVYDNTAGSGTVIGAFSGNVPGANLTYDANFTTGLTIVTTNASTDITVSYQ